MKKKSVMNQETIRLIMNSALDAIIGMDKNGGIIAWTPQSEKIFGWKAEEVLGKKMGDVIVPQEYRERHEQGLIRFLQTRNSTILNRTIELSALHRNGTEFPVDLSIVFVTEGEDDFFCAFVRDITDRKRVENELRKKNHDIGERMKELGCLYRMSQISNDAEKTLQDVFRACVVIIPLAYQYPEITCARIEFEGQVFESIDFAETVWKQEQPIFKKNIRTGKVQVYYKKQMPAETEGPFLAEERLLINSIADILGSAAERKQAEEKLRESEERYKSIISLSNTGAWEYHLDTEYLWCSPEYFSMLGRDASHFDMSGNKNLQETWIDLLHPDDRDQAINHFAVYLANSSVGMYENFFRLRHNNGSWVWVWSRGQTLRDAKGNLTNLAVGTHIDITDRKKTENRIKEQAEIFSAIIENANESIFLLSPDLTILQFNKTAANRTQLNLRKELCVGANFTQFLYPGSERVFYIMFEHAVAGKYSEQETYLLDMYGNPFWLRTRMYPVYDSRKELIGITFLAENITDRKKAALSLAQSEERNRALIENISDTIILVNKKLRLIYQSPSYVRTAGFSMDDHKNKTIFDFVHPDDAEKCQRIFNDARSAPGISIHDQIRLLHKKGGYIWIEGTVTNLLQDDSVKALVVNYRAITERKKLEEQQLLMTSIVNSSEDAIISKKPDGTITSWNHGAEKIMGYSSAEVVGKHISLIIPPELIEEGKEIDSRVGAGASVNNYETQRKTKQGRLIYVSLTISPIINSSGEVIGSSSVMQNITNRKLMEQERERNIHEMLQRNRDLEQFSYTVSHNLRGPVASIMGIADLLASNSLEQKDKELLIKGIGTSVHKLDEVIKDMNHILNAKQGLSENKEEVVLPELLEDVKLSMADVIKRENVTIVSDFSAISKITTLRSYLYSVFYNLLSNSLKYKSPARNVLIEIRSEVLENKIRLTFKDNGLGMDLDKYGDQVFGLYKRFHTQTEGKGIGLFMVKTQVEAIGGKITVKSEPGNGTEFKFELGIVNA